MVDKLRSPIAGLRVATLTMIAVVSFACGASSAPEIPMGSNGESDSELATGRNIWIQNCSSCHGSSGQGGRGKKLNEGEILKLYPEIDGLINVITVGKGQSMPAFVSQLSPVEIEAVSRYIREILN